MTLPASPNSISFSEIGDEFGYPSGKNLGAYRVSETYGQLINIPLDSGIPKSGTIKFSDFHSKKLNVIVNYYSSATATTGETAKTTYNNNRVNIVGGNSGITRSKPTNTSGKKIIVHVNRTIGSTKGDRNYCALKTGSWNANTELILNIGTSGRITGAGGDGGAGRTYTKGADGTQGTSALGIQYPVTVINNGNIIRGTGGGGGGGGAYGHKHGNTQQQCEGRQANSYAVSGGGGGGGLGYPAGSGGGKSLSATGSAQNGQNGSTTGDGGGGAGAIAVAGWDKCRGGATGGSGGSGGNGGGTGSTQNQNTVYAGGNAGSNGYAIIISSSGSLISSSGSGTKTGSNLNPGTPT